MRLKILSQKSAAMSVAAVVVIVAVVAAKEGSVGCLTEAVVANSRFMWDRDSDFVRCPRRLTCLGIAAIVIGFV